MHKYILLSFFSAVLAIAQPRLIVSGPATAYPGQTVDVVISISGAAPLSAVQWSQIPVAPFKPIQPAVPNKSVFCGSSLCLAVGSINGSFNATPMQDGPLQAVSYTVLATTPIGATLTLSTSGFGADPVGSEVAVSSTPLTITVTAHPFDRNGDGKVDSLDFDAAVTAWQGSQSKADAISLISLVVYLSRP